MSDLSSPVPTLGSIKDDKRCMKSSYSDAFGDDDDAAAAAADAAVDDETGCL